MIDPIAGFDDQSKTFTELPIPCGLTVKPSSITGAGLGVFTMTHSHIPARIQFGPYNGNLIFKSELTDSTDTNYMWEVRLIIIGVVFLKMYDYYVIMM